jgi:hypothetical protein
MLRCIKQCRSVWKVVKWAVSYSRFLKNYVFNSWTFFSVSFPSFLKRLITFLYWVLCGRYLIFDWIYSFDFVVFVRPDFACWLSTLKAWTLIGTIYLISRLGWETGSLLLLLQWSENNYCLLHPTLYSTVERCLRRVWVYTTRLRRRETWLPSWKPGIEKLWEKLHGSGEFQRSKLWL